jgi:hypothetical protein
VFGKEKDQRPSGPAAIETLEPLAIYLRDADSGFAADDGGRVVMAGCHPYYDAQCTQQVLENDEACTAERVFYCRLVGGTRHQADLQQPVFDFGSEVLIYPERSNPADPHALLVCSQDGKSIFKAGYLPKDLAASLAPLIPEGEGGQGIVIQTVAKDGVRTGLRIIGSVGRAMAVQTVDA